MVIEVGDTMKDLLLESIALMSIDVSVVAHGAYIGIRGSLNTSLPKIISGPEQFGDEHCNQ